MSKPTSRSGAKRSARKAPAKGDKQRAKLKAAIEEIDKAINALGKAKKRLKRQLR